MKLNLLAALTITTAIGLSGCGAIHTAVAKRNLEVDTKMSDTVFLEHVAANKKTVFIQVRNTSDKDLAIETKITKALQAKGYTLSQDPAAAHYWIQVNVLKCDKMNLRDAQNALSGGFGAGALGAATAASVVGYNSDSVGATVGAGLAGAVLGVAADSMVEDTNFTMITDLQISEKAKDGVVVTTNDQAALKQGNSGSKTVTSTETGNMHKYQTRVVSNANQVNLDFVDAKPVLEDQLAKSISGIL